ncbi:MAG: hypothetical protein C6I00_00425 [Nitratiruptor sp.]|nr:hypothetical protein [Nitratiruptor sp.]NPA84307.1 energy transducer TonB [Campylobacterota bacterium]
MKRAFFLTLAIYLLFGGLWYLIPWPKVQEPKTTKISLSSLRLLPPPCQCNPCTCAKHSLKAKEPPPPVQPFQPPPPSSKQLAQEQPKKEVLKRAKAKVRSQKPTKKATAKRKRREQKRKRARSQLKKRVKRSISRSIPKAIAPPSNPKTAEAKPLQKAHLPPPPSRHSSPKPSPPSPPTPPKPAPSYSKHFRATYASAIRAAIMRHRFYPRLARRSRKEGEVLVAFTLTPTGHLQDLRILRSSGHKLLDRAALQAIQRASKEFPRPQEPVSITVPIEYRLH